MGLSNNRFANKMTTDSNFRVIGLFSLYEKAHLNI